MPDDDDLNRGIQRGITLAGGAPPFQLAKEERQFIACSERWLKFGHQSWRHVPLGRKYQAITQK